jgi:hypothetical protein
VEAAPAALAEEARTEAARGRGGKISPPEPHLPWMLTTVFSILEYANILCLFSIYNVPSPFSCKYFLV